MKKRIFIVNGMGGCGKDTFAKFLNEFYPVFKYSSIDRVKQIAYEGGWNGGKTEKDRKFLSDLKCLLTEYNDLPFEDVNKRVIEFLYYDELYVIMLIDIREPKEIERAKIAYNAKTILIKNDRVPFIASNMADAGVYDYTYDYVIENNGSLDDFKETIEKFADDIAKE